MFLKKLFFLQVLRLSFGCLATRLSMRTARNSSSVGTIPGRQGKLPAANIVSVHMFVSFTTIESDSNGVLVPIFNRSMRYAVSTTSQTPVCGKQLLETAAGVVGSSGDLSTQFDSAAANNLTVVRMFGFGVSSGFQLQYSPGSYNERAFQAFDKVGRCAMWHHS
jgi:hypothetical protein